LTAWGSIPERSPPLVSQPIDEKEQQSGKLEYQGWMKYHRQTSHRFSSWSLATALPAARSLLVLVAAIALLSMTACARSGESVEVLSTPTGPASAESANATGSPDFAGRRPCEDGRLLVHDLTAADAVWQQGIETLRVYATDWHEDSRLVQFRVSCALFEPGFRWQATYYSEDAQALFASDTRESQPYDVIGDEYPSLETSAISFSLIRDSLLSIDFTDEFEILPSTGVDLRMNSAAAPFGPPSVPPGAVIAHVSIEFRGEIKDLFIEATTGKVHQFSSPTG
jgi:hypothetical protein